MEGVVVQALLPVLQMLAIRQVAQSSVTVPQSKFTGTAVRGKLRGASSGRQRLSQRVRSRCGLSVGALCLAVSAIHVSGSGELSWDPSFCFAGRESALSPSEIHPRVFWRQ